MKTVTDLIPQGDVMLVRLSQLNAAQLKEMGLTKKKIGDLKKKAKTSGVEARKDRVVAHSETGHHHVLDGDYLDAVKVVKDPSDDMSLYLYCEGQEFKGGGSIDITHMRPHDTHETVRMICGLDDLVLVRRQREPTPEGWRQVQD